MFQDVMTHSQKDFRSRIKAQELKLIVVWLLIQYTVLWRHRQYNLMNRYNCSHHKYILNPIAMAESMIVSHLDFKTDRQTAQKFLTWKIAQSRTDYDVIIT